MGSEYSRSIAISYRPGHDGREPRVDSATWRCSSRAAPEVMDAVRRMRREAMNYGYLVPNHCVSVVTSGSYVEILPFDPAVIWLPHCDPLIVFAAPVPGAIVESAIQYGPEIMIAPSFGSWGWWFGSGFLWPSHAILIDHRPWNRAWSNWSAYVHPYATHGFRPAGPQIEVHRGATLGMSGRDTSRPC